MSTVYLNGEFLPVENACISVMDRGFLFGDGVYEVIPAYGGCLFRLQHHLQRLQSSLDAIRLANPFDNSQWEAILNKLLKHNNDPLNPDHDQSVYLQVTRGVAEKRDHLFPENVKPTVFASSQLIARVDPVISEKGIHTVTLDDIRWLRCNIKAITLLPNVLLRQQAVDADASEVILIRDGHAIEGSASNLFVVKNNILITPPKSSWLLPGITRDLVLELAEKHQIPWQENEIPADHLSDSEEIWLTSSTREIMPVTRLNDNTISNGRPGPVWQKMAVYYRQYKDEVRNDCVR